MEPPAGPEPGQPAGTASGVVDLGAAAADLLELARKAPARRAARTLTGGAGAPLKQTLLALAEGTRLGEHDNPGVATVQVLRGRVRLMAGDQHWGLAPGDHVLIPDRPHQVESLEDAVILLTVAGGAPPATAG